MTDRGTSRNPSGAYVLAAVFIGFGLVTLVFDPTGLSRTGIPGWLLGSALVLVGIGLVAAARKRL